ncbi:hypothetical protein BCONGLO52_08740 [Brachybacterium conglomeratum]|uniref:Uncharacterized protein n=1 Tax=Brachybacterium conglomeratum TaxID=47846 RepID=A0ABQ5RDQ8_9MICO|nr:hypothetical protein BCONGLO52_08740 [Brachybacterium conglomeratum]GLK04571.1 hypothetical protein GCM10017597_13710 [Brachybacterium conglomeratum]
MSYIGKSCWTTTAVMISGAFVIRQEVAGSAASYGAGIGDIGTRPVRGRRRAEQEGGGPVRRYRGRLDATSTARSRHALRWIPVVPDAHHPWGS